LGGKQKNLSEYWTIELEKNVGQLAEKIFLNALLNFVLSKQLTVTYRDGRSFAN